MKKTKLIRLTLAVVAVFFAVDLSAQINTPAPSPAGAASTTVGLTDIEINYSRPQMKGRKIFGEGSDFLVPFGQMWRSGANAGTTIKFSDDVKVQGKDLAAGEYLLLTIPGKDSWAVSFYSDITLGGNVNGFDESKETLRVNVSPSKLSETVQTLTFNITDISEKSESANIQLSWENTAVNIPVSVTYDERVMKAIAENTKVNVGNYVTAANYYYSTDKDLNQALKWINMYLAEGENSKQFWNVHLKAQILAKMGNKKEAIKTANESMELARNFPRGDFGYIKRNEDLIAGLK